MFYVFSAYQQIKFISLIPTHGEMYSMQQGLSVTNGRSVGLSGFRY